MRRTIIALSLLVVAALTGACSSENSPANTNAPVVETNANINRNLNANTAPANVGVVVNNNGNQNTAGVRSIDANSNNQNNKKSGNRNN